MATAVIISIRETPSPLMARAGQMDMEVQYRIDNVGPLFIYLPLEGYTADKAAEAVLRKLKDWSAVVGKEFQG